MKKRVYAKKSEGTAKKAKLTRAPKKKILLGSKLKATLRYIETVNLNPAAAGVPATYVFSANGAYDPNITSVGHQPRGFDQLMALYDHYIVKASRISINFASNGNNVEPTLVGVMLQDDATPEADMQRAMESRTNAYALNTVGGPQTVLKLSFDSDKFFSMKNVGELRGSVGSNPNDQAYYVIWAGPTTSIDQGVMHAFVRIEYDIEFIEPNNVASS